MKTILSILAIGSCLLSAPLALAQESNENVSDSASKTRFWEAKLPGGSYLVALSRISSVSMHTYHVKGAVVHEVDVETSGPALARFYAIEALGENTEANVATNLIKRGREISKHAGDRTGVNVDTTVHKEYPVTTHAKTIEFRVVDKSDLDELYKSLSRAWRTNKGRKITIK